MVGERVPFIDAVKIVAMFGVVGLHTTAGVPFIYATCSIAIPLFFMTTGYLMYERDYSWKYLMLKLLNILKYVIICNLFYWLIISTAKRSFDFKLFLEGISISGEPPFWHFWFFSSLLTVYLILPLFKINKKYNLPILLGLVLLLQIFFLSNFFLNNGTPFESNIPQFLRMYTWIFYCLLGGIIKSFMIKMPLIKVWHILILFVLNGVFQYILTPYLNDIRCEYFYNSFVVMICCIAVFKYLSQFSFAKCPSRRVISELSSVFLPVFTIHIFLINPVFDMVQPYVGLLTRPISWPIVFLISVSISMVLVHVRYVQSLIKI